MVTRPRFQTLFREVVPQADRRAQLCEIRVVKAFWQDGKRGVDANDAREMTRTKALDAWADLRGMRGNFFGIVDDAGRTLQFYFEEAIPDGVDDARHLRIVRAEIPAPDRNGSYAALVTIGEASQLIERVFVSGADPAAFAQFTFDPW
jgi:hypothetical protein